MMFDWNHSLLSTENQQWYDNFFSTHGRKPRILHIGNIANNAYNNAKILNSVGFDCDVLSYDYYHMMGCPEWEDAYFIDDHGNDFFPNWYKVNLHDFIRPSWFAQGLFVDAVDYLIAKRSNCPDTKHAWSKLLLESRLTGPSIRFPYLSLLFYLQPYQHIPFFASIIHNFNAVNRLYCRLHTLKCAYVYILA